MPSASSKRRNEASIARPAPKFALLGCLIVLFIGGTVSGTAQPTFRAPVANPFEGRVSMIVQPGPKNLRLDIGHRFYLGSTGDSASWRLEYDTEFFTLTRLRSDGNFKFPVEMIDYWFGVGATWTSAETPLHARLRIAHISSHLVDGYASASGVFDRRLPFVYSREFVEVLAGYQWGAIRPYAAVTAVWASQPAQFDRVIPQLGIDAAWSLGPLLEGIGGYDMRLIGINGVYRPSHAAQVGIRYRSTANAAATTLSLFRFDGRSVHAMVADTYDHYWGIGLQVHL
ncbi:MAG: hypothetical protein MUC47_08835 [Candidatus Kapabacteria bacterium]|nr:hypothetical protein [Candidatus Kapabacteria bacterium]